MLVLIWVLRPLHKATRYTVVLTYIGYGAAHGRRDECPTARVLFCTQAQHAERLPYV
jgi:hypothetical protein